MKRLRWHNGEGIRFFHCGEYGSQLGRPHHHALLFNHSFPDLKFYKTENGSRLFESRQLEQLWGNGLCVVGEANFETAAYIARYTLKKVTGLQAESHYQGRVPEYLTMSRRPGIGRGYIDRYRQEVYRNDEVIIRGQPCKPPRYYDNVAEKLTPTVIQKVKSRRRREAAKSVDNTGKRLIVREVVKSASITALKRGMENS